MSDSISVLVIDDDRVFPFNGVVYARTSDDAIRQLQQTASVDQLWLDHDLGGDDTTLPIVDHLVERAMFGPTLGIGCVFVHSMNPVGADTIIRGLSRHYRTVRAGLPNGTTVIASSPERDQ